MLNTETLRRQIDELVTRQIVEDALPATEALAALSQSLSALGEQARASGQEQAARIAETLAGAASAPGNSAEDRRRLSETLSGGLAELERAIEAAGGAGAGTEAPPPAAALGDNPLTRDPELLNDVILESNEHLASVENELLKLEKDPENQEAIHTAFRSFHTIKGLAGFLELTEIQQVAHQTESLLDEARNGRLTITPEVADVILASKDYLDRAFKQLATVLRGGAPQPFANPAELIELVRQAASAHQDVPREAGPEEAAPPEAASGKTPEAEESAEPAAAQPAAARSGQSSEARTVKVDTAKLDYLVEMIGELVIAQSQVRHDPNLATIENPRLQRNMAQLARTTTELQKVGMAMRMVPVGILFRRMVRLARDLSRKAGKQTEVEIVGEETELDRTIVEELADPLVHMVRNSLDHGLEPPEERRAQGKPATGRLTLRASHQAGHILIEVADDGRGIDRKRVLAKALERGLIADGSQLSDTEVFNLIFEPGFSTAERVTDISGRGVGMDVVRKQIQKLRGRIEIQSRPGRGTTFLLKLPLTLAIIDGLVISVGRERYIVPLFGVRETFRPSPEMISTVLGRGEIALVRGALLPVVRLYQRFGVEPRTRDPAQALIIVAESGNRVYCLMVDDFIGKQEVVIRSLGETLKNIPGVAGGAILGDGRVGLVLDLDGVAEGAR
jgi:two-component system, chemotaxis family, sensor kinase CheA